MTTDEKPRIKITYATLRADNEELHTGFEAAVERVRASLGGYHRNVIDGQEVDGEGTFEVRSPIDTDIVLGTFASGTAADSISGLTTCIAMIPSAMLQMSLITNWITSVKTTL